MKIVITGGGTGGHVFPAVAIANELRARGHSILYVGSAKGFEAKIVPKNQIAFRAIRSGAIKNQGIFKVLVSLLRVFSGFWQSLFLLSKERPHAVVGVGGYVSVPVCLAAVILRLPLFIQEQNVSVGIANRLLGRLAVKVFLGFDQAKHYFPHNRVLIIGNPLRREFKSFLFDEVQPSGRRLLILGGSQGARAINLAVVSLLPQIRQRLPDLSIVHQTGEADYAFVRGAYEKEFVSQFEVFPFIDNMIDRYQQTSLVLARAGALTVSEILFVKRPAIFVPYPRKGQNDQIDNANHLKSLGVAETVEQGDGFQDRLFDTLMSCLDQSKLRIMQENFSSLQRSDALATICDQIEGI